MHEFSICQRLVDAAIEVYATLEPAPTSIKQLKVVVGAMHQIVPEYLDAAYEALIHDTVLKGSSIHLKALPVRGRCLDCGWEGEISPPVFQCADCHVYRIDMIQGNELYLESLELEV